MALKMSKIAMFGLTKFNLINWINFDLTRRRRGSPGTITVKFLSKGHRWPRYQMA